MNPGEMVAIAVVPRDTYGKAQVLLESIGGRI